MIRLDDWLEIECGYRFVIKFEHDGGSIITVHEIECPLNDALEFNRLVAIMENLELAISENREEFTEDVADFISEKTGYSSIDIFDIIEPIIKGDVKHEEYMALVHSITVYMYSEGYCVKVDIPHF